MVERYPDDAVLLAIGEDAATGVEYIPTGRSPYFLEFRRLVQRLLLAAGRANDLRVYQDGELTVGVRPGRCLVRGQGLAFAGLSGVAVTAGATTWVWLDANGVVQKGTGGLPVDRTGFVPLAEVAAGATGITAITDLRGEAFLGVADAAMLGLTIDEQYRHEGDLTGSLTGKVVGAVPVEGTIRGVYLTVGTNLQSTTSTDGVTAVARINGAAVTSTHPKITSAAGSGFKSTAQGDGTTGAVKTDGTADVLRGDLLTVDLTRTAAGTVSVEASNVVVLVVIGVKKPD